MARSVILWSKRKALITLVEEALAEIAPRKPTFGRDPALSRPFDLREPTGPRDMPPSAAFVVTTGSTRTIERFALTLGAMPLCLPEAAEYLLRYARRAAPGDPLVLVGFDLRPSKPTEAGKR